MCVHRTDYFVKFGDPDDLWPELQTQSYIFDYARSNPHPDAPRIPQVVHHFGDSMTMYLVMEFITLTAAPIDRTAQALVWLSSVPPPPNHVIGPLGGGCIRHKFRHLFLKRRGPTTVHAEGASVLLSSRASTVR